MQHRPAVLAVLPPSLGVSSLTWAALRGGPFFVPQKRGQHGPDIANRSCSERRECSGRLPCRRIRAASSKPHPPPGPTHEGLRSYRWDSFGEVTGAETLQNPATGGVSWQN